ncbi:Glycogen synthase (plasmid) [Asticcacaulis sp. MM231]|uniref:glycosyltransferase family 4 protein n=1 Tax=Asticcacaulis sp. MM231 TaxID=3157666 RepID=UPI0032D57682
MSVTKFSTSTKVAVLYHFFPHYRAPVLRALAKSEKFSFSFWGDVKPLEGIMPFTGDESVYINRLHTTFVKDRIKIEGYNGVFADRDLKALIILGNPNILATWKIALWGRLRNIKVLFWTHGWLRKETLLKAAVRNLYYSLSNCVLVYSDRAKTLAMASGFNDRHVVPIYNSLDWTVATALYERLDDETSHSVRNELDISREKKLLICTARITTLCRFDLLLSAVSSLNRRGYSLTILLVGDGPERSNIEKLSKTEDVDVRFLGSIYDEALLARLIYASDLTVSPGKVGLTAMHSLSYGTPVVTHSDLDAQMPEVEALTEGVTGFFFEKDNVESLSSAILRGLAAGSQRESVRVACREIIRARYTPEAQRQFIETALDDVLGISR